MYPLSKRTMRFPNEQSYSCAAGRQRRIVLRPGPAYNPAMATNTQTLERLFAAGDIDIARGALFDRVPGSLGGGPEGGPDFDRVEGMLLGLAIGDALGRPTEAQLPERRAAAHGELRDYLPTRHSDGLPIGLPSDDSQIAFWTLEQLIESGRLRPERLARLFATETIYGIGKSVLQFVHHARSGGVPWYRCGVKSAGNGALMRIAPVLVPHLREGTTELWVDTALAAMLTHNDSASIASCLAFVDILRQLMAMDAPPPADWWPATWIAATRDLEVDPTYESRAPHYADFQGPLWRFVERAIAEAEAESWSTLEACNAWYSGAYLLETVPSALYILMRHADDPEEAIVRAVNDSRDNDTTAAIVGAAVGALHGHDALPERWLQGLTGRTRRDDDGHMFALLAEAGRIFGDG